MDSLLNTDPAASNTSVSDLSERKLSESPAAELDASRLTSGFSRCDREARHYRIMVVDDVALNAKLVCAHLSAVGYNDFVVETNSTRALTRLYETSPDLLLLDMMMPDVDGLQILEALRADPHFAHMPILVLTATTDRNLKLKALQLGATDFLNKPLDAQDLIPRVQNALLVKSYQDHLEEKVRARTLELQHAQQEVLHCLARAAEYRDNDTGQHVVRVSRYATIIARELGMPAHDIELLSQATILHDMGKIGIPDSILLKPGRLTEHEYAQMKEHCEYGHDICSQSTFTSLRKAGPRNSAGTHLLDAYTSPLLKLASSIAATHHEKWDGTGYPQGLAGEDIPIEGRITAVADVFDALGTKRPYKEAFDLETCVSILKKNRGHHFEPRLVDLFLGCLDEVVAIREEFADE
jgi:putative two-component system response regulator